jgi:hypothetical protein
MGGRLRGRLLCTRHNNETGSRVDRTLSTWFAPWTLMLAIPKQGGGRGASFAAETDDGRRFTVEADGRAVEENRIVSRDEHGVVTRAEGSLEWTTRLRAKIEKKSAGGSMPLIEIPGALPNFELPHGVTREIEPGIVKIALHFVAGLVPEIHLPYQLRRIVEDNESPAEDGRFVRPLPFESPLFGDPWPPRHEVTAYPAHDATYVTLMLFGAFSIVVRLPDVAIDSPVRYVQTFDGAGPSLERVKRRPMRWYRSMSCGEWRAFFDGFDRRLERIDQYRRMREDHDQWVKAARTAYARQSEYGADFPTLFRAELELYLWPADKTDDAVMRARRILDEGGRPWEVPTSEEDGRPYDDGSRY